MPVARPVLVLDFDGTVCLGDGPVWAYADNAFAHLPTTVAARARDRLTSYLNEPDTDGGYADGYTAIAELAGPYLPAELLSAAYTDSRAALSDPATVLFSPPGLGDLLASFAGRVQVVVFTNAPPTGLDVALSRLGLAQYVDQVIPSAHKPQRAQTVLRSLLGDAPPYQLMSVGDLWANDIEPAWRLGCATAFIDRTGADWRPSHLRAQSMEPLYPGLKEWAFAPETFVADRAATTEQSLHTRRSPW